jgi:hypothetical protein
MALGKMSGFQSDCLTFPIMNLLGKDKIGYVMECSVFTKSTGAEYNGQTLLVCWGFLSFWNSTMPIRWE